MSKRTKHYQYAEAHSILVKWIARKGWTQVQLQSFLGNNGIIITAQTCSKLVRGEITPGRYFKQVFKAITGVTLVDGLVEDK